MLATPRMIIAGVVSKNSKLVPTKSTSTKSALIAKERRKGGKNTLNPEAAARLIPINAASITPASSMIFSFYLGF
jgi:hypothetical protein